MKERSFDLTDVNGDPFFSLEKKSELTLVEPVEHGSPIDSNVPNSSNGRNNTFLFSILTDLIFCVKNNLFSINNYISLPFDKLSDATFRNNSQGKIKEDIKKVDILLNSLLNYISINTPIQKTNGMYVILEEILEANEKQTLEKNLKIFRDCEQDLPETLMHSEQVRFILNSLIQYAILSTPANGSMQFVMKNVGSAKPLSTGKTSHERNGGHITFVTSFTGEKNPVKIPGNGSGLSAKEKGESPTTLILKLVEESIQKNLGAMKIETDEKLLRTHITVNFNIERRRAFYYEPINI